MEANHVPLSVYTFPKSEETILYIKTHKYWVADSVKRKRVLQENSFLFLLCKHLYNPVF